MADTYFRKGFKWAKVSGERGAWTAAVGWKSDLRAVRVYKTATKLHASVIAKNWVEDQ